MAWCCVMLRDDVRCGVSRCGVLLRGAEWCGAVQCGVEQSVVE